MIMDLFSPEAAVELIQTQKVSIFGSFPPILGRILTCIQAQKTPPDLSSLEIAAGLESVETAKLWESRHRVNILDHVRAD